MILKCKALHPDAIQPKHQTAAAAGLDLQVMIPGKRCCDTLMPGHPVKFGTGIACEIPEGYVGLLTLRSGADGLKLKNGIFIIDSDYRGEIKLPLYTELPSGCRIEHGERVAQLVVVPYAQLEVIMVDELSDTERGSGGFGHTGKK